MASGFLAGIPTGLVAVNFCLINRVQLNMREFVFKFKKVKGRIYNIKDHLMLLKKY